MHPSIIIIILNITVVSNKTQFWVTTANVLLSESVGILSETNRYDKHCLDL